MNGKARTRSIWARTKRAAVGHDVSASNNSKPGTDKLLPAAKASTNIRRGMVSRVEAAPITTASSGTGHVCQRGRRGSSASPAAPATTMPSPGKGSRRAHHTSPATATKAGQASRKPLPQ